VKPPISDDDSCDGQNDDSVDDECSCPVDVHPPNDRSRRPAFSPEYVVGPRYLRRGGAVGQGHGRYGVAPTERSGHLEDAKAEMIAIVSPMKAIATNIHTQARAKTRARRESPRKVRFQEFVNPLHRASSWRRSTGSPTLRRSRRFTMHPSVAPASPYRFAACDVRAETRSTRRGTGRRAAPVVRLCPLRRGFGDG
jgi:hypothetical protein